MPENLGVNAVREKGQLYVPKHSFDMDQPSIPFGMRLVGIVSNGAWETALDLTNRRDYSRVSDEVMHGKWRDCELHLLEEELVSECPDEGRVRITRK